MAKVDFEAKCETLHVFLSGEIDHHSAQMLRREIDDEVIRRMPEILVLDFSNVAFMDSSGIGLILGRSRQMNMLGGRAIVQSPPVQLQKVLELAKIDFN